MDIKQRMPWIDMAKTLGIYLVVLGHALLYNNDMEGHIRNYIYSFHMPLFFFISGYLYRIKNLSLKEEFCLIYKQLFIPYILLNLISFIFLIPLYLTSDTNYLELLFYFLIGHGNAPSGPSWFLICLIWLRILGRFLLRCDDRVISICIVIFAIMSYFCPFDLWWDIDSSLMALPFYFGGYLCKKKQVLEKYVFNRKYIMVFFVFLTTIYFSILNGRVALFSLKFGINPFLFFINAFLGIFVLLYFSKKIEYCFVNITSRISTGTILIMGVGGMVYTYLDSIFRRIVPELQYGGGILIKITISYFVVYMFLYITPLVKKRWPSLLGGR